MCTSIILHHNVFICFFDSGEGTEKENLAVEKEFEAALAKGHRPCESFLHSFFNRLILARPNLQEDGGYEIRG